MCAMVCQSTAGYANSELSYCKVDPSDLRLLSWFARIRSGDIYARMAALTVDSIVREDGGRM
jgi:hypothetical protein